MIAKAGRIIKSMTKLHILNEGKSFKPAQVATIRKAFKRAVKTCKKLIAADAIDVVVSHNPAFVMTEIGIGGKTQTSHFVNVTLDAKVNFDPERLSLAMCHEMHHAMRQRKCGFPQTLFDVVVSEGLADQFEAEINPRKKLTAHKGMTEKVLLKGLDDLRKQMNTTKYDYYGWFFGAGKTYPKYFGYVLGGMIITAYLNKNKTKPSKLVTKPTKLFAPYIEVARKSLI